MDLDSDPFADESGPAVSHVRGRFQPKAKPRLRKETTVPVDVVDKDNRLFNPVGSSVSTLEVVRTVEQLKENESSEHALHSEVTAFDGCGGLHSSFQKAVGQAYFPVWNLSVIFQVNLQLEQRCQLLLVLTTTEVKVLLLKVRALTTMQRLEIGEIQQEGAFSDMNCLDFTSEEAVASVESVMHMPNAQFVTSGTQCMSEGSIPASVPEDCFDYSSIDLGDTTILDRTSSELPVNEKLTNCAETSLTDAASSGDVQLEYFPAMTENQAGEVIIDDKLLRQLRKGVAAPEHVNKPDNEAHNDGSFTVEPPSSAIDEV